MYEKEDVDEEEAKKLTNEINAIFVKTSAKESIGIEDLFNKIGNKYLKKLEDKEKKEKEIKEEEKEVKEKEEESENSDGDLMDEVNICIEKWKKKYEKYKTENKKLKDENRKLKADLLKLKEIKIKRQELEKEYENNKFEELNKEITFLNEQLKSKNNEIDDLKAKTQNKKLEELKCNIDDLIVVYFRPTDYSFKKGIKCSINDTFVEVEEKLYQNYNELRNTNNSFKLNENQILRFKTLSENHIKNFDEIELIIGN